MTSMHEPLLDTDVDEDGHGLLSHWLHPAVGWLSDSDVQRITSAVVFMALLLAAYGLTRSLCFVGIPYDGTRSWDAFDVTSDAEKMMLYGFLLVYLVGLLEADRFLWLFSWRRWYFFVVFFCTIPVYGAISNVPSFRHSLTDIDKWGLPMWMLVTSAASAVVFGLAWQLHFDATRKPRPVFTAYLLARIVLVAWCLVICAMLRGTRYDHVHVHHLYLGWSLAIFANANHPISAVMLAIGAAIFVQGIGAYSFADIYSAPARDCPDTWTATV